MIKKEHENYEEYQIELYANYIWRRWRWRLWYVCNVQCAYSCLNATTTTTQCTKTHRQHVKVHCKRSRSRCDVSRAHSAPNCMLNDERKKRAQRIKIQTHTHTQDLLVTIFIFIFNALNCTAFWAERTGGRRWVFVESAPKWWYPHANASQIKCDAKT